MQTALISENDYATHAHHSNSTPNFSSSRRQFTCSHPPSHTADSTHYYTPQVQRRGLGQVQSSPVLRGASDRRRGSRVLSLTQDGIFTQEEGVFQLDDLTDHAPPAPSNEEEEQTHDEGIQFATPTSSQWSFTSDGGNNSPITQNHGHTPLQSRPQSSTLLGEEPPTNTSTEPCKFDRNRSMSYPTHKRPGSAGHTQKRRVQSSAMEGGVEGLRESLDSGLDASSETSLASTDSSLHYSTLGVSALCVLEAVKSMLDHK